MTIKINMYFLSLRLSALCDFALNSSCFDLKVKECGVFGSPHSVGLFWQV